VYIYICHVPTAKLNVSLLQNDLDQGKMSAYLIREYRVLWLRLSQIASETGEKLCTNNTLITSQFIVLYMSGLNFMIIA
jgi:hypothetical protein